MDTLKILATVKPVIDPYVKIRVNNNQVERANIKISMNPFDEIALEEAIRLKEQNHASEIIALTIGGSPGSQETLRQALALGASSAIWIKSERTLSSLSIANILSHIVAREKINLVLMGKQSIDGDNNQTPQMLAGLLDWSQATFASKIIYKDGMLQVTREIDGGLETLEMPLPAVISADLRLNEPRYATLPNIMKAKQKPLEIIELDETMLPASAPIEILSVRAPQVRSSGVKLDSVQALLDKLQLEAHVL